MESVVEYFLCYMTGGYDLMVEAQNDAVINAFYLLFTCIFCGIYTPQLLSTNFTCVLR